MLSRLQESDIKLLRVFYAVASCNGFTAAEPVLRMQRPNISAAIKKLEARLDLILCHRGRGGFQITKEGEVVYQETKRIFNAFDNFVFNLKNLHDDYSGHVTLVLMSGLPLSVHLGVSRAVKSTMKKFDDIHINIQNRLYNEVEHVALSGECHLVLATYDMVKPESVVFILQGRRLMVVYIVHRLILWPSIKTSCPVLSILKTILRLVFQVCLPQIILMITLA